MVTRRIEYKGILNCKRSCFFKFSHLSCLLNLCTSCQVLLQVHAKFVLHGADKSKHFSSRLVECYGVAGHLDHAWGVFQTIEAPDVTVYNVLIRGLLVHDRFEEILLLHNQMLLCSISPDEFSYASIFKSCCGGDRLLHGKKMHSRVVKISIGTHNVVGDAVVRMYAHFKELNEAVRATNDMFVTNELVYNLLFSGLSSSRHLIGSVEFFRRLRLEGFKPDSYSIITLLRTSGHLQMLEAGRHAHLLSVMYELQGNLGVNTALLTMYSNLGCLETAQIIFERMPEKDCVVWNLMIATYSQKGLPENALQLLAQMVNSGLRTDLFTSLAAISSAADFRSLRIAKQIHAHIVRNGSDYQVSVHNSVIHMYNKCGSLDMAKLVFSSILDKTVVSWCSMIRGYLNKCCVSDALSLFDKMRYNGIKLDEVSILCVLPIFDQLGILTRLENLHGYMIKQGLLLINSIVTALVVSYAKLGCIVIAEKLFNDDVSAAKDVVCWNAMITAYAKHGFSALCFCLYKRMKEQMVRPDPVTFVGLLTACVNSGLVQEGWSFFKDMIRTYKYEPNQEHYACLVILFGQNGQLDTAADLVTSMPFEPDARVWGPLLTASRKHSETRLIDLASEKLIQLEPKNAGNYIILSNIYAAAGRWDAVSRVRLCLRDKGLKKKPGCSWLEINGCIHEFHAVDRLHQQSRDIYDMLNLLYSNMEKNSSIIFQT